MSGEIIDFIEECKDIEPPIAFGAVCAAILASNNGVIDLEIMATELGGLWFTEYETALDLHRAKQRK